MTYDLEIGRVIADIKKEGAKRVCIQLPDGLKPQAKVIQDEIEKETDAKVLIWAGSCYGACDTPSIDVDMLFTWGHSKWNS